MNVLEYLDGVDCTKLTDDELARLLELVQEQQQRSLHNKIEGYDPYQWQRNFHALGKDNPQRLLMAGNRTGKTYSGAAEMSFHLTGLYPDDWDGRVFDHPIRGWAAGISNPKTRDVIQLELLGLPEDPTQQGTGAIPGDCILSTTRLPGVPNAVQSVVVKHYTNGVYDGNSRLGFLSYEMGFQKFMGSPLDVIWLDEQPEYAIFSQCITRTADTGGMLYMTFTPEMGMTPVIHMFMHDLKPGQALIRASWDECPHLTEKVKAQLLAVYLPHERDMRTRGEPVFGSGMVFPVPEDFIMCDSFIIPDHWERIAAIDFGWDHPTGVVWIAIDPADKCQYVYATYRQNKTVPALIATAMIDVGRGIPTMWPHDGHQEIDRGSNMTIADQYRDLGINMHFSHFTNPPPVGMDEDKGGNGVDAGILAMLTKMESGKFKVFRNLNDWFEEFRTYHRKDGKIVKVNDDLMSATRYASQMTRFALTPIQSNFNTKGKIKYPKIEVI